MNIRFDPLELIDVQQLADDCSDAWYNRTLCAVNESVVRLGVMQGEYHWHQHDDEDEFCAPSHAGPGTLGGADGRNEEHRPDRQLVRSLAP